MQNEIGTAIKAIADTAQAAGLPISEEMLTKVTETKMEEMTIEEASKQTKQGKTRAGFTTNKGNGTSKTRRKMARQSRKMNRK